MKISLIVAMAENRVIGRRGKLPWRIPEDMKDFKKKTMGKPIVMGRKTFQAIGVALPGRTNIVVTRNPSLDNPDLILAPSVHAALKLAEEYGPEVMVIGGGEIYAATLPLADRIYLTEVHETVEGDATFPPLDRSLWSETLREDFKKSEGRPAFSFVVLDRK
ncbi:MAG: dihydrofolate reductase [Sphingomonadales bacterium]